MEKIEFIISEFQKCNIELSQDKADKLLKLYEFLVEYNQNVNLTAITDFEEVVVKHFIDSVLPFSMIVVCVMIAGRETGNNGILKMLALPVSTASFSPEAFCAAASFSG